MKAKSILIGSIVGGALLVAAAVLVGPALVQDTVESELAKRLEARGIDATWSEFSSAWGRTFELEGVAVSMPEKGLTFEGRRVTVSLSVDGLLEGEPSLESIRVEAPVIELDLAVLEEARGDFDESPDTTDTPKQKSGGLVARLLEDPPDVEVTDATLKLLYDGEAIATGQSPETAVHVDGKIELDAHGTVALESPRFGVLKGSELPVVLTFSAARDGSEIDLAVKGKDDGFLLDWSDPERGAVRVRAVSGSADATRGEVELLASDVMFRVGVEAAPALAVAAPSTTFGREDGRFHVRLDEPSIDLTPSRRERVRDVLRALRPGDAAAPAAPAKKRRTAGARDWFRRASALFYMTDVRVADAALKLWVEGDEEGEFNALTLLERFDITSSNGHVSGRAETAGGTISGEASVVPGRSIPNHAVLDVVDVDLGKIPGMPSERSQLPNRGTSGRVAGVVNARLAMVAPSLGVGPFASPFDAVSGVMTFGWNDGVIDLTGVSEDPLEGIDAETSFAFTWYPSRSQIRVSEGRLDYGPVDINFDASVVDWPLETTFTVKAEMEEIACEKSIRALPRALLGPYRRIELDGEWAPKVYFKLPIYSPRKLRLKFEDYEDLCTIERLRVPKKEWPDVALRAVAPTGPHASVNGFPEDYDPAKREDVFWMNRPFVKRVTEGVSDPENSEIFVGPGLASYVPIEELPAWVPAAAYLSEQMLFYDDPAISIGLIKKALRLNLEKGRFVYGGSTVTQQLVKNLILSRDKTLSRKLREALISWRITQMISKDRVLELYVNCIEFGPDIYGVGPAAKHYFQKDARDLTPKEALFLAMLKPAPWYGAKVVERKKTPITGYWAKRTAELYQRLLDKGFVTQAQIDADLPHMLEWDENGKYKPSYKPEPAAPWAPLDL